MITYDAGNIAPDDEDIVYEYNSDNTLKRILQKYEKDGEIKYRRLVRSAYDVRGNVTAIKTKNGYYQNVTYDAKNRLKKAEGDYSEYWYDADDNRIDMYDHSTNMKYTYDCAGGRSRLVWTSSHLYEVTTYAYGAEGLIWSRTDGSYQVYHYDYRGSVIAVTDIDGNITDTITYTAYGKQASRTGTSKLIFGYNGRHGVLSDPNGLLYMRTRFYNPDFKRFMSADIIDGSIADSTSLNVYAFVNGNPISLIDPFGLIAERGEPSVLEAAYMAKHIYTATEDTLEDEPEDYMGGWKLIEIIGNSEGLKIGVYARGTGDDISYTLVNKGTTTAGDWVNNFQQLFGLSDDMKDSIAQAKEFVKNHPDANITFAGHSKGGAEAVANAVANNKNAIVFNPATTALSAYGLSAKDYTADMTVYVVKGEILHTLEAPFSEPIDKIVYLEGASGSRVEKHSIDTVIERLIAGGYGQ